MSDRLNTLAGELVRLGFQNASRCVPQLEKLSKILPGIKAEDISWAASPDLALQSLVGLAEIAPGKIAEIWADSGWRTRVIAVLGSSMAIGRHLWANLNHLDVLADESRRKTVDELSREMLAAVEASANPEDQLRLENKRQLTRIAARDLTSKNPLDILDDIAGELADLADAIMKAAFKIAFDNNPESQHVKIAVVGLGKCGAQELNYLSDIDVLYVGQPADEQTSTADALRIASQIVGLMSRICSDHTKCGTIWPVDAALRPEGKAGPLVRTLESHASYYAKYADNWEYQAMIKARPMAGDLELGKQFCEMVANHIWQVGGQQNFLTDTQQMRKRVVSLIPANQREREIKLGSGGLRDVEFTVQLLQLVHGRADERIRQRATLPALAALVANGYVGRTEGALLAEAYRFERCLEHRQQLFNLRRTHLMPDDPASLRRLARQMGFENGEQLNDGWRQKAREVLSLQQRIFYSPLLDTISKLSDVDLQLSPGAVKDRLHALGFADTKAASNHIAALITGTSRAAKIRRQLMPAMVQWFSEGPNPDLGLLSFRQVSETMGTTDWYLRALRDEGWMAERLARILSSSRYISDLLRRDASMVQFLANDDLLVPRDRADLIQALSAAAARHNQPTNAINSVRALRRRELFRLAVGDMLGIIELYPLGIGLAQLADATINAAIDIARRQEAAATGVPVEQQVRIGVISMGRWGGRELSYSSDADAMYLVPDEASPAQIESATRIMVHARTLLRSPSPDPPLEIDAGLRPEGKNGPLVRTLSNYENYYRRISDTWEAQALLRAEIGAGDDDLVRQFLQRIDQRRYRDGGINDRQIVEIRRLKARMETERAGRNRELNLKLGPGGLSDIEWTVQLIQLQHAHEIPELRTTSTIKALQAATSAGLIASQDAELLRNAWVMASQLRNRAMLVRGRGSDLLPSDTREVASVAMLFGYGRGEASNLIQDWHRAARHAGQVVDRIFWGKK